mmetsp:Transcript_25779/g.40768  ORF Transcript_25779/g.40768 Transcript_25779/m.40768 type:complete len:203 (-) Transcript_25779:138-746(-)
MADRKLRDGKEEELDEEEEPEVDDDGEDEEDEGKDNDAKMRARMRKLREARGRQPKGSGASKGVSKDGDATKSETRSFQKKLGLTMPVHRFRKQMRAQSHTHRMGVGTAVILTSIIEYITSEVLELAGNTATEARKGRITPQHIQQAVRNDEELNKYLANVTIAGGGVVPNVHISHLPKKPGKTKVAAAPQPAQQAIQSQEF